MILEKINTYIDQYKTFLKDYPYYKEDYKWEALQHFQQKWDINAEDLPTMYEQALDSNISRQLWTGEGWEPKKMMKIFLEMEPEFMRSIFKDLLDESKDAEGRMNRFVIYCDEMLKMYKRSNQLSIENNHFHGDYRMASLYLAFNYPQKYTLYEPHAFRDLLERLGAKNISPGHDMARFVKVCKIWYTFLKKDKELIELQKEKIKGPAYFQDESMLIVHDFYWTSTQSVFKDKSK